MASTRGTIIGRILLKIQGQETIDCSSLGPAGYPITGDFGILDSMRFDSDARYILVVEKDAVFQRLAEDCLFNQIPCILITAKGYPDLATRFLLHRLSQNFPELSILALVDWNPAGLAILCTYKFGSMSMGLEAYKYACNVKWLGLHEHDLEKIPPESFIQLKPRDLQTAKSLMSSEMLPEMYRKELALMVGKGTRVDIEALYFHGFDFLGKYISSKIVQAHYI